MNPQRRGLSRPALRSPWRRRPVVELLESRQLLAVASITEFPVPTVGAGPVDITTGSDGNLWFTEEVTAGTATNGGIGMINPRTHAISEFPIPTPYCQPGGIVQGSDGNFWFTESYVNQIGMIDPTTHKVSEFPIPSGESRPLSITAGPDGNLWFTENNASRIAMINPTSDVILDFKTPTEGSKPYGITVGPDGNLWFTEAGASKIASINPTTQTITEFALPSNDPPSEPEGIAVGPDGKLWFTEYAANQIGSIDPKTHVIAEMPLPTGNAYPNSITSGPDGNLWFTESYANQVGMFDPKTRTFAEYQVPTASSYPEDITAGPDGNLWFTEGGSIAMLRPSLSLILIEAGPIAVAPGTPVEVDINVDYQTGLIDTAFNGNVTIELANAGGAILGGTLTVAARNGVAIFSGLTVNQAGNYQFVAYTDTLRTKFTTPVTVAVPLTIVAEKPIFAGTGRRRHVVGFEIDFSTPTDPARSSNIANYLLTQTLRHGRKFSTQPVAFRAAYDATTRSVTLTLTGRPKFTKGGRLVVVAAPGGLTDAAGVALDGGNLGMPGDDGTFVISPKGAAISR